MNLSRRALLWGGAGLVAAGLLAYTFRPTPIPVEVTAVARGPLRVTIDEEGRTRVRDRYVVVAPATGRVARITLEEGALVTHGMVVARLSAAPLDPRSREQALARLRGAEDAEQAAAAAVSEARAALDQATRNRVRAESLFAKNLLAPAQREEAALAETTAVRRLQAADFTAQASAHDVEQARAVVAGPASGGAATLPLVSPVRGRVLRIPEKSERVVTAGTPLLELGDPARLEIVVDLLSEDAVKVHPGDRMLVGDWGGDRLLEAHVRVVEPSGFTKVSALGVEEQRVHVIADLDETPPQLGDGYRVETQVVLWEGTALKAPASALFQDGDQWRVFVVRDGRARSQVVQVGHRNPFEVEIAGGLAAGDLVVRQPTDKLADGVRVAARSR
ncbi:MAG TPA: HlyD family efflux transporter periplasmic adaptor subunit [Gemmatimonadales bacterium]|nr:HlyD family efflux transporter periplasmic adaptor subunit [Gemmatimonadales bacterium]